MKRAIFVVAVLWVAFMLVNFIWGDWRHAAILLLFPFAMLVANFVAIPIAVLGGVLYGFWRASGRTLGISVELI